METCIVYYDVSVAVWRKRNFIICYDEKNDSEILTMEKRCFIIKVHRLRNTKTAGEKSQKTSKKLLTNERTHGILNELRLERVESTEP